MGIGLILRRLVWSKWTGTSEWMIDAQHGAKVLCMCMNSWLVEDSRWLYEGLGRFPFNTHSAYGDMVFGSMHHGDDTDEWMSVCLMIPFLFPSI